VNAPVDGPVDIALRIDRLVVETEHAVDAFALQRALTDAVRALIIDRGVPAAWRRDTHARVAVVDGFAWDGRGAEPGLAQALAVRLYEEGLAAGAPP
jgi:hypothetical protein